MVIMFRGVVVGMISVNRSFIVHACAVTSDVIRGVYLFIDWYG